jgi:hypothetical protein
VDKISQAMRGTNTPERMVSDVLDTIVEAFACDR